MGLFTSLKRKLKEPSTIVGVATIVAPFIAQKTGLPVDATSQLLMTGLGALLVGSKAKKTVAAEIAAGEH